MTITIEQKLDRYYRNLPSYLKPENNRNINALLRAWAGEDTNIENAIIEAKEQLYVATADGAFLDRLAANCGITRPSSLYLDDETFRQIIPILCHGSVITKGGLSALIDALFGKDAQRAHCTSLNPETYRMVETQDFTNNGTSGGTFGVSDITDLAVGYELEIGSDTQSIITVTVTNITGSGPYTIEVDSAGTDLSAYTVAQNAYFKIGETLTIESDQGTESLRFPSSAFADHNAATVAELVAYYNAHMTLTTATVHADSGSNYFRIRTNTIGASGYVLIVSGTANDVLNFDNESRCQNASIIISEPGTGGVVVETPTDTTIVTRTLKGSWHLRADESIVDSRPTIDASNPFYPGAFLASPATDGFIRSTTCLLQETITAGDFKNTLLVDDSSNFPDEAGFLTVSFGVGASEEGPFTYNGRPSNTTLLLNPAREFTVSHAIGETINLSTAPTGTGVEDYGAAYNGYKPRDDGSDYMAFVTDPLTTSIVLSEVLENVTVAGIPVDILTESITYRWAEL